MALSCLRRPAAGPLPWAGAALPASPNLTAIVMSWGIERPTSLVFDIEVRRYFVPIHDLPCLLEGRCAMNCEACQSSPQSKVESQMPNTPRISNSISTDLWHSGP